MYLLVFLLAAFLALAGIIVVGTVMMVFLGPKETTREQLRREYHNVAQQYATIYDRDYSCGTSLAEQISSELYGLRQRMKNIEHEARVEMER